MATATVNENMLPTCPVCFDWYKEPRKLSVCSHSFCEKCIVKYVTTFLKTEQGIGEEFQCPVCRATNPCPSNDKEVDEWVQRLDIDTELLMRLDTQKEGNVKLCVRCQELKRCSEATRFCLDCQEYLCKFCCEIGHGFKTLKNHVIFDRGTEERKSDEKEEAANETLSKYLTCPRHSDSILTLVDKCDNTLCGVQCTIENHSICNPVTEIGLYSSFKQTEETANILTDKFIKLVAISKAIIEQKRKNEIENKKDTFRVCTKIREMRAKLNSQFDALEENISQQCKALTKKYTLSALEDIETLQDINSNIAFSQHLLDKAKQKGSPNLFYVLVNNLQEKLKFYETSILDLRQQCKNYKFDILVKEKLGELLELGPADTDSMVLVKETVGTVALPKYTERKLIKYCAIEKFDTRHIKTEDMKYFPFYTGVAYLPEDRIIFVDNFNGLCCLVSADCSVIASCKLTSVYTASVDGNQPVGVAYTNKGTVAISMPTQKKLVFASVDDNLKILGEVHTKYMPWALSGLRNGDLAVSWSNPHAFGIITLYKYCQFEEKTYFDRDTNGRIFKQCLFMAVDENRQHVIQSCEIDKTVYCFDFRGNPKFTYTHSELVHPQGVSVDADGNIYVCETKKALIHILSPEGVNIQLVTFKEEHLKRPVCVAFKIDAAEFVVTDISDTYRRIYMFRFVH